MTDHPTSGSPQTLVFLTLESFAQTWRRLSLHDLCHCILLFGGTSREEAFGPSGKSVACELKEPLLRQIERHMARPALQKLIQEWIASQN